MIIGTAGALELDNITLEQAIIRSVILLLVFYISSRKYFMKGDEISEKD
jgi:hypothetical protein